MCAQTEFYLKQALNSKLKSDDKRALIETQAMAQLKDIRAQELSQQLNLQVCTCTPALWSTI